MLLPGKRRSIKSNLGLSEFGSIRMKKLCMSYDMEVSFLRLSLGYLSAIAALYHSMVDVFNKPVSEGVLYAIYSTFPN